MIQVAYKAHREWTEKHIREIVDDELKKIKKQNGSAVDGFFLTDVSPFIGFTELYNEFDSRVLNSVRVGDYIETIPFSTELKGVTTYYTLIPYSTLRENNERIFAIITWPGSNMMLYPYFRPHIKGDTYDNNLYDPRGLIDTLGTGNYFDIFAYQNGNKYPIKITDVYLLKNDTETESILFRTYRPVLTYEDFFHNLTPTITKEEFLQIYSEWDSYNWDEVKHTLCINFRYKEVE